MVYKEEVSIKKKCRILPTTLDNFLVFFFGCFCFVALSFLGFASHLPSKSQKPLSLSLSLSLDHTKRTKLLHCLSLRRLLRPLHPPTKQPLNQSLTDATFSLQLLFSTSAGIRQLGSDQPFTGMPLLFQFVSRIPPRPLSLSNSSPLAIYFYACFDPVQTPRKLGFSP